MAAVILEQPTPFGTYPFSAVNPGGPPLKVNCQILGEKYPTFNIGFKTFGLASITLSAFGIIAASQAGYDLTTEAGVKAVMKEKKNIKAGFVNPYIPAGKFLTGHPDIDTPFDDGYICIHDGVLHLATLWVDGLITERGRIPLSSIEDVMHEDESVIEKRYTATRILAAGVFALAMKKTEKTERHYVTIKWNDGRFTHESIFELSGPTSPARASSLRNTIIRAARNAEPGA